MLSRFLALVALAALMSSRALAAPEAVIITPRQPDLPVLRMINAALTDGGYAPRPLDFDQALEPGAFRNAAVVTLPDATELPAGLHEPLEAYLRGGGDLIAIGLPAWKTSLLKIGPRWVTSEEYAREAAWRPAAHPVADFSGKGLAAWKRSHGDKDGEARYESQPADLTGPALHATLSNLQGWDTLESPPIANAFPNGSDRTVFTAKGDANTTALAVEWKEKDGSRWIATVPLTTEWRRYELAPEDFRYWTSNPARGKGDDRLNPANANVLSVGLAFSHTGVSPGRHEWWIANVGTARAADAPLSTIASAPPLDGLYPGYKSFRIHGNLRLSTTPGSPFSEQKVKSNAVLFAPHPRPSGQGFNKDRRVRFFSMLEAQSREGAWRGAVVSASVHTQQPYKGGTWLVVGSTSSSVLMDSAFVVGLTGAARWLRGPKLAEAGTDWYTYFPGTPVTIGARLATPATLGQSVRAQVIDPPTGNVLWTRAWPAADAPVSSTWQPPAGEKGPWTVSVDLLQGDDVADHIEQQVHVWSPSPTPHFITTGGGQFLLDGKPWKAHGVNYMPSSGIARDLPTDAGEFENWIGKQAYDSRVVARDLDNVRAMNLNAISAFIYADAVDDGNLLDLLRLCDERGLKVNLSLRPGTPMDFQWDAIRPIIETYRLKDNDVLFAYDLAWEPFWGNRAVRARYDAEWTDWVTARYGSLKAAEKAWGYKPDVKDGRLVNPADAQTVREGKWTKMVVDYRVFLNGLLAKHYGRARDLVRGVDPNHAVSFRMTETSNPTWDWDGSLPYDFMGLKDAVDIWAPEGYGRMGAWDHVKPGWFEVEYARAIDPNKPLFWAEAGQNIWQPGLDEAPMDRQDAEAGLYDSFYQMLMKSGSNGIFWWWYPGGFRTGENSDYGIINPDGTDRPVTKLIRDRAAAFLAAPAPVPTDAEVTIHLNHASGLFGAYQAVKDQFWGLVDQGKNPRVVIAPDTDH